MENRIAEKVKRLLALANDNPNDEEGQTAMLMAQQLLAKHGLSMSDVDVQEKDKTINELSASEPSGRIPWWKKQLSRVIADNFKCTVYQDLGKQSLIFFGFQEDIEVAKEVYTYGLTIIDTLAKRYVGKLYREGKSTKGVRNIFINGFLVGLDSKFKEQVESNNWGLVVMTDALVVQAFEDRKFRKAPKGGIQPKFANNEEARQEGYRRGEEFAEGKTRNALD